MDGDPAVESGLDSFSLTFPLPFRVAFIVVMGVWGWAANLHYLYLAKIDVPSLIRYPQRTSAAQKPHHTSTYRLAALLSATLAAFMAVFWTLSRRDPALVVAYDWIPMTCLAVLAALFVVPMRDGAGGGAQHGPAAALPHTGRRRLLATLRRVVVGGLAEAQHGKFGDILLADVLTSYAKVLADLYVCLCMFLTANGSATARPDRGCGGTVVVPLILALPSLARLRQCLIEYLRVRRAPYKESVGWGGQHLANAAKYATAFPVVILSALQRNLPAAQPGDDAAAAAAAGPGIHRAWLAAVLLNSLYSFYWDVAKDWDLSLFSSDKERNAPDQPFGLRPRLHIQPAPGVYYLVIGMDLLLRCTWALKLSPHLDRVADFESSVFVVELLEVFRRWVWIFFRVETEHVRSGTSTPFGGLGIDDIMLGDYGKYEDED